MLPKCLLVSYFSIFGFCQKYDTVHFEYEVVFFYLRALLDHIKSKERTVSTIAINNTFLKLIATELFT